MVSSYGSCGPPVSTSSLHHCTLPSDILKQKAERATAMTDRVRANVLDELQRTNKRTWATWVNMNPTDIWKTEMPALEETITIRLAGSPSECKVSRAKLVEKSGFFRAMLSSKLRVSFALHQQHEICLEIDFNFRKQPPSP